MTVPVSVKNIGKKYRIGSAEKESKTFVGALGQLIQAPFRNFRNIRSLTNTQRESNSTVWALRNVNFEMQSGEVLGIIGRNGAGKSTLLKILSRITEPTEGEIRIHGQVSSLLEVGTGFHPELTGHENIFMNGTILGMTRREIQTKYDEIVAFSGVEQYIHTPVKFYSSGMKVRLAFSVAAHLDPDILIIDEVLAVGDAEFQRKCLGKLNQFAHGGRTVLFVSHDMGSIQSLCSRAILLENGTIVSEGSPASVVEEYLTRFKMRRQDLPSQMVEGKIRIVRVWLANDQGLEVETVITGQPVSLAIDYQSDFDSELPTFSYFHLFFKSITGVNLFFISTKYSRSPERLPASGTIRCRIEKLPLLSGSYVVDVCSKMGEDSENYVSGALSFHVENGNFDGYSRMPGPSAGAFVLQHEWSI